MIVTSDTLVWLNNKALGKPKDYDDAFQILKSLSNQTHEVITSVCFKTISKTDIINEITKVTFTELSDDSIRYYLDNYKPFDKAGAYGIQEWIGLVGISKIEGSYTNSIAENEIIPTKSTFTILIIINTTCIIIRTSSIHCSIIL